MTTVWTGRILPELPESPLDARIERFRVDFDDIQLDQLLKHPTKRWLSRRYTPRLWLAQYNYRQRVIERSAQCLCIRSQRLQNCHLRSHSNCTLHVEPLLSLIKYQYSYLIRNSLIDSVVRALGARFSESVIARNSSYTDQSVGRIL